ncbi:hypothetical protein [Spirillospora sp. NPDC048819]|uniref:hypothetical protein n=1 Tax=Spirillospora sp. NPDC048819 TaxID=3155268 RepID=UPI0033DEC9E4
MNGHAEFRNAQQRTLSRYGVAAESRHIDVPAIGGSAHVLVAGEGPPLVMVIGGTIPAAFCERLPAYGGSLLALMNVVMRAGRPRRAPRGGAHAGRRTARRPGWSRALAQPRRRDRRARAALPRWSPRPRTTVIVRQVVHDRIHTVVRFPSGPVPHAGTLPACLIRRSGRGSA